MTRRMSSTIPYAIPLKVQIAKIYNAPSVLDTDKRCRVTTYSIGIPVTVLDLVVLSVGPNLPTYEVRESRVPVAKWGHIPVEASTISKIVVMREKKRMAEARTVRVGQRLIRGAMRIAPTHWAAWLIP